MGNKTKAIISIILLTFLVLVMALSIDVRKNNSEAKNEPVAVDESIGAKDIIISDKCLVELNKDEILPTEYQDYKDCINEAITAIHSSGYKIGNHGVGKIKNMIGPKNLAEYAKQKKDKNNIDEKNKLILKSESEKKISDKEIKIKK